MILLLQISIAFGLGLLLGRWLAKPPPPRKPLSENWRKEFADVVAKRRRQQRMRRIEAGESPKSFYGK